MPGMNGFELLKLIKSRWPELKVVMVSAYAGNSDYVMEAKEQGAADFLTKPMDFDIIREKIVSETSTY
jgi:DNA-binding NtrC family response regulator